jgi:hypothetical protein
MNFSLNSYTPLHSFSYHSKWSLKILGRNSDSWYVSELHRRRHLLRDTVRKGTVICFFYNSSIV